jgi:hypothetical protein
MSIKTFSDKKHPAEFPVFTGLRRIFISSDIRKPQGAYFLVLMLFVLLHAL